MSNVLLHNGPVKSNRGGCFRIFAALLVVLAAAAIVLLRSTRWLTSLGGRVTGARLDRARNSPEYREGQFRNAEPTRMLTGSYREMAWRQFFGREQREPAGPIPVVRRVRSDYSSPPASGLRATWIGWASVLVEIDGRIVLTDPVWSDRCSPSTLVGPRRFHAPPIAIEELPHVDLVVISHDHYDHLDMLSVQALAARGTHFAVPLGVGAHLERWAVPPSQIHELDWNDTLQTNGLSVTATSARHYSGRNPMHGNETLWASWVIAGPRHRIFFSGDSGYSAAFAAIGAQHGPFDLTLIKIGASDPTWSEVHMSPEEAVQAHRDLRGVVMLPVHWGTFNLAFHAWRDPADRAVAAASRSGVPIVVPKPGEFVEPSALRSTPLESWWDKL
jgi:L-ascorbate metabolism protein UlaG (beta-lactamase superfamily)